MIKNLLVIFALVCLSQANLRAQITDDILATNNGQITLNYIQGSGYTATVDFAQGSAQNTQMAISLYSSITLLTQSCLQFNSYQCLQYSHCSRDQGTNFPLAYPYFNAQANIANTVAILDYSSWSLQQGSPVYIATACGTNAQFPLGSGSFGLLGLGFEGSAQKNFLNMVSAFSVYYNAGAFRLQFNPNLNFNKQLVGQVRTNQNWMVQGISSISIGTFTKQVGNVGAIFDINSDAIGFPLDLYNAIVPTLNNFGIFCPQGAYYQPTCNFNGGGLPNLVLTVDPTHNIILTPAMYTLNSPPGSIKLNLKALGPTMTGLNYVTPSFNGFIILGNSVLGNNYVYFNTNDRTVSLYQRL